MSKTTMFTSRAVIVPFNEQLQNTELHVPWNQLVGYEIDAHMPVTDARISVRRATVLAIDGLTAYLDIAHGERAIAYWDDMKVQVTSFGREDSVHIKKADTFFGV